MARYDSITDVPGVKVGHWTNRRAATGCTVVLCEKGAVGGVDVRGAAPGTRETDLLRPGNLVQTVNAIVLAGGSAFGLDAASGVVRWCEEHGVGLEWGRHRIPIVSSAILMDLNLGRGDVRPDAEAGYVAAVSARAGRVAEGSVGAGTGATVAKVLGFGQCLKGGIGTASEEGPQGLIVGAVVAANAVGEIVDSGTGKVVAGPRGKNGFVDSMSAMRTGQAPVPAGTNTTIGVVATNARLSKEQTNRLATVAHDGLARAVRPAHTMADGDTLFALSTGEVEVTWQGGQRVIEALAALAVERAIVKGVLAAKGLAGVPSVSEWRAASGAGEA